MEEQDSREVKPDIFLEIYDMAYASRTYPNSDVYSPIVDQRPLLKLLMHEFCEYINSNQDGLDIVDSIIS